MTTDMQPGVSAKPAVFKTQNPGVNMRRFAAYKRISMDDTTENKTDVMTAKAAAVLIEKYFSAMHYLVYRDQSQDNRIEQEFISSHDTSHKISLTHTPGDPTNVKFWSWGEIKYGVIRHVWSFKCPEGLAMEHIEKLKEIYMKLGFDIEGA